MFYDKVDGEYTAKNGLRRIPTPETKQCRTCGDTHPASEFMPERTALDFLGNVCSSCRGSSGKAPRKGFVRVHVKIPSSRYLRLAEMAAAQNLSVEEYAAKILNSL